VVIKFKNQLEKRMKIYISACVYSKFRVEGTVPLKVAASLHDTVQHSS